MIWIHFFYKRLPTDICTLTVLFSVKKERDKAWTTNLKTHTHTHRDLNNRKSKIQNVEYSILKN